MTPGTERAPSTDRPDSERVREAFERFADAELADLGALVDREFADRPDLGREVRRLLESDVDPASDRAIDRFERVMCGALERSVELSPFDLTGVVIGRYRVVRELGRGAFGAVYIAEQVRPVARRVALKLLHPGAATPQTLRRFHREREMLASLQHPGIARLLDAGTTPDGRPYFVMDLVEGADLLTFVERSALGMHERVRLFLDIARAVEHAHGNGVIHRDLKPSNILVREGQRSGDPEPVVIDFGVGRWIRVEQGESGLTVAGGPVGTDEYMSPEQAAGRPVDVRTDVFQLGKILRRALGCGSVAVPRELQWIVQRCTEEDPDRRYPTAESLGADLQRWCDGLPVEARQWRGWSRGTYLAKKFVGRHRVMLAVLSTVAIVLGALAVVAADRGVQAAKQRDAMRLTVIQLVDDVMPEIKELSGTSTARENLSFALDSRIAELLESGQRDPALLARHAMVLEERGDLANMHERFDDADRFFERALAICRDLQGRVADKDAHLRGVRRLIIRLGDTHSGRAQRAIELGDAAAAQRHYTLAEGRYREAHSMILAVLDRDPGSTPDLDALSWSLERLALKRRQQRDMEEAVALAESRLEHAEALLRQAPAEPLRLYDLACAHDMLAELLLATDAARARTLAESCLSLSERLVRMEPERFAFAVMPIRAVCARMRASSRLKQAEESDADAARALELVRQLVLANPGRTDASRYARAVARKVAMHDLESGRPEAADRVITEMDAFLDRTVGSTGLAPRR